MKTTKKCRLSTTQLRRMTDLEAFDFQTTETLPCLGELIGQDRAVRSMAFGLEVKSKGYNIFVLGEPGSGRTTYTLEKLREKAKTQQAPDDWVYVYNFDAPNEPLAVNLPAGQAKELAVAVDELVEELKQALSKAFDNSQYEDNKAQLVKEFQERVNNLMEELRSWSKEQGFAIKRTPQGFVNIPIVREEDEEGNKTEREMQQEEFETLEEAEQKRLQKISEQVSQKTLEVLRSIRDEEKELKERIRELEAEICRNALQPYLADLKERFAEDGGDKLKSWISSLAEDIITNFGMFVAAARDENAETDFTRYSVNVLVSNSPGNGAAVVWETNPTYYNLVGKVEYESRQGYLYTDFKKIVGGAIHRANGGYLVLDAEQFFRQFMSWDALKRVLRTGELNIENLGEQLGFVPVSSLRPQAIPIDMKVVIIGTRFIYHLLTLSDPDFQKLFKIKADYALDMPPNAD
ncbi:MAG: AAA family ATPase, partial [Synergistales bacterium]|nr:AAA family ATPase [Synergistales bacterium]